MATKRVGTRRNPTSPLYQGAFDPDILKGARKIQKSQSSPSLCASNLFDLVSPFSHLEEKKESLSWSIPTLLVSSFQVFTDP